MMKRLMQKEKRKINKRKGRWIDWIICHYRKLLSFASIILALVFTSFFGGTFSYALLYCSIAVPVVCLVYLLYVYNRLKVYQFIDSKITIKGETIPYAYMLVNEDWIYYANIALEFLDDCSTVDSLTKSGEALPEGTAGKRYNPYRHGFPLPQKSEIRQNTRLTCLFRGEYPVGIDNLYITDFIGLFTVKRRRPSLLNLRVYPRVPHLESLSALQLSEDIKHPPFSLYPKQQVPDVDLRQYVQGDSVRRINWKASARGNELVVRKYTELPDMQITVVVDLYPGDEQFGRVIAQEDLMIESVLALTDYTCRNNLPVHVHWHHQEMEQFPILDNAGFQLFYDACCTVPFRSSQPLSAVLSATRYLLSGILLVVCAALPPETVHALQEISSMDVEICVILVGDRDEEQIESIQRQLSKIRLIPLRLHQTPEDVLL